MSDRFYTTIKVSGHNADAAAKSAMQAFLNQPEGGWRESWYDDSPYGPVFFDHDSGQGAVITVTEISRKFPEATFHLYVDGSFGEGYQGPIDIKDGAVSDGMEYLS